MERLALFTKQRGTWKRADIAAVVANRSEGTEIFYANAREMAGAQPCCQLR
jgi:hypothetical protein